MIPKIWYDTLNEARDLIKQCEILIHGYDINSEAVSMAQYHKTGGGFWRSFRSGYEGIILKSQVWFRYSNLLWGLGAKRKHNSVQTNGRAL